MPKVPVYNQEWKQVGEMELSPIVFGVSPKEAVLHQAVIAQLANRRRPVAHTKTRGEVRGGGKKPWRQKGTGRARHGSIRSPLWIGGGITFGPRSERNFELKMNRKARNLALRMSLSDKVAAGRLLVLSEMILPEFKTKAVAAMIGAMPVKEKKLLLILPARDERLSRSARNLTGVRTTHAASLSVTEILSAGVLLTTKDGIEKISGILGLKSSPPSGSRF